MLVVLNKLINYIDNTELLKIIESPDEFEEYIIGNLFQLDNDLEDKLDVYLDFLEIMVNDRGEFVRQVMRSYTLEKEYNKLGSDLQQIFTPDSFVELLEFNVAYLNTGFTTGINDVFDKMRMFIRILRRINDVSKSKSSENDKLTDIKNILMETPIEISSLEKRYINEYCMNCFHIFMDIYFICRSNKYRKDNLLTLSYFGGNHVMYISHYFVNIVGTHHIDYHKEVNTKKNIKRIVFDREINLNEIMGVVVVPISRRSSSRKSASPPFEDKTFDLIESEIKNEVGKGSRKKRGERQRGERQRGERQRWKRKSMKKQRTVKPLKN